MDLASMKIVVGGGATGGAAAALLLARAGARVTVLERVGSPRAIGAGIGLADNGLAVLESLGLGPALANVACPVGAARIVDGVDSRVREGGRFGARRAAPGIPYLRALVSSAPALGEEAWTAAGLFGSFAVADGVYIYASAGSRRTREAIAARDLGALRAAWAAAYPPSASLLAGVERFEDLVIHPVQRVGCARWHDGRLVLVGDAAHAMAPNLGQGANSALVDAAVLLDELRRGETLPAGLAAYEARRRPAVRRVAAAAARLGALAEWTHPLARRVRDRGLMPLASRLARPGDLARLLQEPRETLLAIGRA